MNNENNTTKTQVSLFPRITSVLQAITCIEDTPEDDECMYIQAWQFLIDTGVVWQLQGWFGRTAMNLINEGICQGKS